MKVDTTQKKLVRGYVVYSQWRAGCISMDGAKDEKNIKVGVAYTPWHRHDECPAVVEAELTKLQKLYSSFQATDSMMMGFEYRDYDH